MVDIPAQPQSPLFSLPAELRNQIYRLVLIRATNFDLIRPTHFDLRPEGFWPYEPDLLHVSRQIRTEALDIYYQENTWAFHIQDFDATLYLAWCRASTHKRDANIRFWLKGDDPSWANFMSLVEAYYHDECCVPEPYCPIEVKDDDERFSDKTEVWMRLFDIVDTYKRKGKS